MSRTPAGSASATAPLAAMTRTWGSTRRNARMVAGPPISGIIMSVSTAAIPPGCRSYRATASDPSPAVRTR